MHTPLAIRAVLAEMPGVWEASREASSSSDPGMEIVAEIAQNPDVTDSV